MVNRYYLTAGRILNDVAVDVGLDAASDAVASTDKQFVQLERQLNIAVEELAEAHQWEQFKREYTVVIDNTTYPDYEYPLPTDFHYMIDQTHWDRTANVPMTGPLSSQTWQYLQSFSSVDPIYVSFRVQEGLLALNNPTNGNTIAFEYASKNWIRNAADSAYLQEIADAADTILLPPSLVRSYLKSKYLGSKGFQTIDAVEAVSVFLGTASAKDAGAPVLRLNRRSRFPLLDARRNVPDNGYGA